MSSTQYDYVWRIYWKCNSCGFEDTSFFYKCILCDSSSISREEGMLLQEVAKDNADERQSDRSKKR